MHYLKVTDSVGITQEVSCYLLLLVLLCKFFRVLREVQQMSGIKLCDIIILLPSPPTQLTLQEVSSESFYPFKIRVCVTQHFSCKQQKQILANLSRKGT